MTTSEKQSPTDAQEGQEEHQSPAQKVRRIFLSEQLIRHRYAATLTESLDDIEQSGQNAHAIHELYPHLIEDLMNKGLQCLEFEQFRQSCRVFSFLLQLQEHPLFCVAYADSLFGLRRYQETVPYYKKAIEQAPQVPGAYYCLAQVYMIDKQPAEAIPLLETMLTLDGLGEEIADNARRFLRYAKEATNKPAAAS